VISRLLSDMPDLWDMEAPKLCESVTASIEAWRGAILRHNPRVVRQGERPSAFLITDACEEGWGAYFTDSHGRESTASAAWSNADKEAGFTKFSAYAESEAMYRACCRFLRPSTNVVLAWATDNTQGEKALLRGHSKSFIVNTIATRLSASFPNLRLAPFRIPGEKMPVDGLSRGKSELTQEEWEAARQWVVEVHDHMTPPG
jgi:hypothetical protein